MSAPNTANWAEFERKLQLIAESIVEEEAVLFPCAGLSMSVGAPSWEQLIEPLKSELSPPSDETDPRLLAQFYRNQNGEHAFFMRIREIFRQKGLRPGPVHAALADLPVKVILTTNFDNLIEGSLIHAGKNVHIIRDDAELALWNERLEVQVLKLHGDLDSASTLVLSDEDYYRFLAKNVTMRAKLVELLRYRSVIFIGCSMRDIDLALLQRETHAGSGVATRWAYNLTFSEDAHDLREWRRKGIDAVQIPQLPSEDKGKSLARVLSRLKRIVQRLKGECDVLLVDDDDNFLENAFIIEKGVPGTCVEVAKNGYEAAAKMERLKPKIVFVDACLDGPESLEGFNGFKFVESFRKNPSFADTQFIIISGFVEATAASGTKTSLGEMAKSKGLQFLYKTDSLLPIIERRLNQQKVA